ncbi:SPOSA6832_01774, partial [Sporobolomyces salmonicolor]
MGFSSPSHSSLYDALASLRLALPFTLLGLLALRWLIVGFSSLMSHIQSQGWKADDTLFGPPDEPEVPASGANKTSESREGGAQADEEDGVTPVVVRTKKMRCGLVLGFEACTAATYFADGAAQVVATLITSHYTPSDPLYANVVFYSAGGLAAFSLLGLGMAYEARRDHGLWPTTYPRALGVVALAGELAVIGVYSKILAVDPEVDPVSAVLPVMHLGILAFRILALTALLLAQTPLLYRSAYCPCSSSLSERTSLLSPGAQRNGYSAIPTSPSIPSPLRATKPPSNRPPDSKSLSILTLFSRVRMLFPYLWPSKSLSLQILAMICFALMLVRRYVNVVAPIFFGRIISDLSAGRPPYRNVAIYVAASFFQDSNTMLYRYLWLPISQYSEREMSMMSFDTLLKSVDLGEGICPLSLSYHTRRKTGELLRILNRTEAINDFCELFIFDFIPVIVDLPVAFVVLSVRYGGVIVGVVTLVSVVYVSASVTLAQSRTKLYRKLRDEGQFMHQIKTDTLLNYESVKTSTSEAFEMQRLRDAMHRYQKGYFTVYSAWNSLSLLQNGISLSFPLGPFLVSTLSPAPNLSFPSPSSLTLAHAQSFGLLVCSFILAHRVVTGAMDIGSYVTFVSYLSALYSPLNRIASLYRQTMSSLVDTEQLLDLLGEEKDIVDREDAVELKIDPDVGEGGDVEFRDVRFSYDGRKEVLKGISFKVEKGQSVALVGPSGMGKSTVRSFYVSSLRQVTADPAVAPLRAQIMRCLYRFYDVSSGSISINNHDIRDLTQISLRRNIGLVPQDPVLFNETTRYNIAYGGISRLSQPGKEFTMEDVIEAAKSASMHDKIMSFPDVRYLSLSVPSRSVRTETRGARDNSNTRREWASEDRGFREGRSRGTIAIARTILKNPPTSALDTHNERAIQTRLRELVRRSNPLPVSRPFCLDSRSLRGPSSTPQSKGRTTIMIAHRLSTIVDCDVIHVLNEGVIAESGSHTELLAKGGIYAELWQKQSEAQDSAQPSRATTPALPTASKPASGTSTPARSRED